MSGETDYVQRAMQMLRLANEVKSDAERDAYLMLAGAWAGLAKESASLTAALKAAFDEVLPGHLDS